MKEKSLDEPNGGSLYTVFIAADIEGVTCYVNWPEKPPEETWFREQIDRRS